jgi:hypothetical protein
MLKNLRFTTEGGRLHIQDYPDAVALKQIDDRVARRLQAMTLHQADLSFCQQALAEIERLDHSQQTLLAEALWISSIARYFKCFGKNKARTQLSPKKILRDLPGAESVFDYFEDLRNKHIIHDENPYSQAFTGIVLNGREAKYKVADIVAIAFSAFTVNDDHLLQLRQLVDVTSAWVTAKREELHTLLGKTYEQKSYDELLALPEITFSAPDSGQVDKQR